MIYFAHKMRSAVLRHRGYIVRKVLAKVQCRIQKAVLFHEVFKDAGISFKVCIQIKKALYPTG